MSLPFFWSVCLWQIQIEDVWPSCRSHVPSKVTTVFTPNPVSTWAADSPICGSTSCCYSCRYINTAKLSLQDNKTLHHLNLRFTSLGRSHMLLIQLFKTIQSHVCPVFWSKYKKWIFSPQIPLKMSFLSVLCPLGLYIQKQRPAILYPP